MACVRQLSLTASAFFPAVQQGTRQVIIPAGGGNRGRREGGKEEDNQGDVKPLTNHSCPHTRNVFNLGSAFPEVRTQSPGVAEKWALNAGNGGPARRDGSFLKSIYGKGDRNRPPSANQGLSRAEPRHGDAVCTHWVHYPPPPCPTISGHTEPISKGHCQTDAVHIFTSLPRVNPNRHITGWK